jgi:hypothetical protein
MSRLSQAQANAFFAADYALSKQKLEQEIEMYEREYLELLNEIQDEQQELLEGKSNAQTLGALSGCGVMAYFSHGEGLYDMMESCATGAQLGSIAGSAIYSNTADMTELDQLERKLEDLELELSSDSRRYANLGGKDTQWTAEQERNIDLDAFNTWEEAFIDDPLVVGVNMLDSLTSFGRTDVGQEWYAELDDKWFD